jgi:hypothetical protein
MTRGEVEIVLWLALLLATAILHAFGIFESQDPLDPLLDVVKRGETHQRTP